MTLILLIISILMILVLIIKSKLNTKE